MSGAVGTARVCCRGLRLLAGGLGRHQGRAGDIRVVGAPRERELAGELVLAVLAADARDDVVAASLAGERLVEARERGVDARDRLAQLLRDADAQLPALVRDLAG